MREPPPPTGDQYAPRLPPLPEPMPGTVRRVRQPSQSLDTPYDSYDSMPLRAMTMTIPVPAGMDDQPSIQVRALRKGQLAVATAIITGSFITSRILGVFRTTIFGYAFGASAQSDAFTLAFTLPNAIYNLVAGGALSSAFIPIFTEYMINKRQKQAAWNIASISLNVTLVSLVVLAAIGAIFIDPIAHLYAYGIFASHNQAEINQVLLLSRIMLLQPIVLGLSVVTTSVLQARQRFLLPAIGSVLYNVGQIAGILATIVDQRTHIFGGNLGILGPTYGVIAAAAMQLLIQIPGLLAERMRYIPSFNFLNPGMVTIYKLMAPRFLNSLMLYVVSVFVTTSLLSALQSGAVYGYQQAFQIALLPISMFGMALSQAAFPTLSTLVATRDWGRMRSTVLSSVRIIIYLSVPAALGMIVLAQPIVSLLLVHGQFAPSSAYTVYVPLIAFSIGVPSQALIEILDRAYYALQDARTAVIISIFELFFAIALSIILIEPFGAFGVAIAQSIGLTGEALALLFLLRRRIGWFRLQSLGKFTAGVIAAGAVAALAALLTYTLLETLLTRTAPMAISSWKAAGVLAGILICAAAAGSIVYYLAARFINIDDTVPIDRILGRIMRRFRRSPA
jgi:putative peptidoglycan lipid II flippase